MFGFAAKKPPPPLVGVYLPGGAYPAQAGHKSWQCNVFPVPNHLAARQVPLQLEVQEVSVPLRYGVCRDNRDLGVMVSLRDIFPAPNPFRVSAICADRVSGSSRGA